MERLVMFHHDLHSIPEIGFSEYKTKEYILSVLSLLDCTIHEVGNCGIIAYFNFGKESTIGFRCELDGLPIYECKDSVVRSVHEGVMHACGHDAHMAILLALAEFMNVENSLYNVLLIFQSGEELRGGALEIMENGILQSYGISAIFGMHVWPGLSWGSLYSRKGAILAGSDEIDIEINGESRHIAESYMDGNALLCASELVLRCSHVLNDEHRCNFGILESGTARNVSSNYSILRGSLRYFDDADREYCIDMLEKILASVDTMYGTVSEMNISKCNTPVVNHKDLFDCVKQYISISKCSLYYQSEDFGEYSVVCPTLFLLLGCGEDCVPLHSSTFWVEDELVLHGLEYYKRLICSSFL